jgi:hypothetical protein
MTLTEVRAEIERLTRHVKSLKTMNARLRYSVRSIEERDQREGVMTLAARSAIAKALHPDSTPSEHDRAEAFKAFTAWRADANSASRRR